MPPPDNRTKIMIEFDIEPLGHTMVFLLPSVKLEQRDLMQRKLSERLDEFLHANFSGRSRPGATVEGWWKDKTGKEHYGEHRQYTVSFDDDASVKKMNGFLAEIAVELGEMSIYCMLDNDAYLIYPRPLKQADAE
jgi:hypothetical protein